MAVNLARGKPTFQDHQAPGGELAVNDNVMDCSQTNRNKEVWFAVDLGTQYAIRTVVLEVQERRFATRTM